MRVESSQLDAQSHSQFKQRTKAEWRLIERRTKHTKSNDKTCPLFAVPLDAQLQRTKEKMILAQLNFKSLTNPLISKILSTHIQFKIELI